METFSTLKERGHKIGHRDQICVFGLAFDCSKLLILLDPQVALEPTTLRLTEQKNNVISTTYAERLAA